MNASVQTAPSGAAGLAALIPLAAGRRLLLVLTVLAGLLAQAGTLAALALGAWLAGQAVTGTPLAALWPGMLWLAAAALAGAGGRWWQAHVSHDFAFALIETLQMGVYDGLERAAPGRLLGRRTGELASVATADAELMELFYAHMLGDVVGAVAVPLGALANLALIHPLVALALLPFLPLLASVPFWLAGRAAAQGRVLGEALGRLQADVVEGIQGRRELAFLGRERTWLARMDAATRDIGAAQRRYGGRSGLEQAAVDILLSLATLAAALPGAWLSLHGRLAPALLPLVLVLAGAALTPITEITQTARRLGELRAGAARLLTIMRQRAQVPDRGHRQPPATAAVRFERVDFGYSRERGTVLRGVDFEVRDGETVALVGASGAGKTTCANLLLRFWDPDAGAVRIGGIDLRDLPLDSLRRLVAVVPQDIHLFDGSVADNIRLGRPDAGRDEMEFAARLAQAHDFIAALPQGYDTPCGEKGARLSGGQRQRIAIARALLTGAPVLVLDEASSSLDSENERALQAAMEEVRLRRTLLLIAHRPSTIRGADRIVVLEDGRVAQQGTHRQLLAEGGAYARLMAAAEDAPAP